MEIESSTLKTGWRVLSASVTGTSHEKRSQPCQDAHCWQRFPTGVLVAAVADGAGSASLGEVGAQIAVGVAVDTVGRWELMPPQRDMDWQQLLTEALKAAQGAVIAESANRDVKARELASTLILVVATPEQVAVAQVGDGAAVVGDAAGNIASLTAPPCGEYINETIFLVSEGALETAQIRIWDGRPAHLAIFSDGLQLLALKMPEGTPHIPFFSPLFRFAGEVQDETDGKQQLESFLRSPRVTERTDDDLTLLLASFFS